MKPVLRVFVFFVVGGAIALGQSQDEATRLLREYVSIDTSNPPG